MATRRPMSCLSTLADHVSSTTLVVLTLDLNAIMVAMSLTIAMAEKMGSYT
jgi:hypothetical protein